MEELTGKLAEARKLSKLDSAYGFYQIPFEQSAQETTTFITPFGRYKYHRLPMGISLAPEIHQRKMTVLLTGLEGVIYSMDDVLLYGKNEASHDDRLHRERTKESRLKLNRAKCCFRKDEHLSTERRLHSWTCDHGARDQDQPCKSRSCAEAG